MTTRQKQLVAQHDAEHDPSLSSSVPSASEPVIIKQTILCVAANPVGTDRLALDREARAIQVELERSRFRDRFALETRWAAEPLDLLRELRKLKPTVVHFIGHGASDGADSLRGAGGTHRDVVVESSPIDPTQQGLYLQGADGRPHLVSAEALAQVFGAAGSSVKLVVLNACYSDAQAGALLAHVGCVVGIRGSICDAAARSFAIGFYGGLGECESVAAAYRQGCAAIALEGLADRDKPRLMVRDGGDAALIVLAVPASGDPTARSRGIVSPSTPAYVNAEVQVLSERLRDAQARKRGLRDAGLATDEVDREVLQLRRELREGGQLRAGDTLGDGRYVLIRQLGRGGFAVVWEAHDTLEKRSVAVKALHQHLATDPQRRERFFRGARVMMELEHSAVVRVYDPRGEDDTFCYFVMELVPGATCARRSSISVSRQRVGCRSFCRWRRPWLWLTRSSSFTAM